MDKWITDRIPMDKDGATVQYIGPSTSAIEEPREGGQMFVIVDAGHIDYRCRCWMSIPRPDDSLKPMLEFNND